MYLEVSRAETTSRLTSAGTFLKRLYWVGEILNLWFNAVQLICSRLLNTNSISELLLRPILDRFGDVGHLNIDLTGQIGDGPGQLEDAEEKSG